MDDASAPESARLAAAKSLAQLGEPDVLRVLYRDLGSDQFMSRYMANIGLKALSGKDLNDFEGYNSGEGAYVIGGNEMSIPIDAIQESENKAKRFRAMAAYFHWLRRDRPDLYKHVSYGR